MMEHGDVLQRIRDAAESGATALDLRGDSLPIAPEMLTLKEMC